MKRPWQIWLLYCLALVVALPAPAWLTVNALRLEQVEGEARAQAEREEHVRLALWRLDTRLTPLVAQETARPYDAFAAMEDGGSISGPGDASPYVLLHFQVRPEDNWSSPRPADKAGEQLALRLKELQKNVSYENLVAQLPQPVPSVTSRTPDASLAETDPFADVDHVQQQLLAVQRAQVPATNVDGDFAKRQAANLSNSAREFVQQRANLKAPPRPEKVQEGIGRPFWLGDHLLLARRAVIGAEVIVQGCWLDWEKLQADLRMEVADLISQFEFLPVRDGENGDYAHRLSTLPVRLVVPVAIAPPSAWTPLRVSLLMAWTGVVLAAIAIAALMFGVVSLSQRRAAFVSAVTHELRTPLTSLRIYAEMLAENMVPDEQARKDYLRTLRVEADRLAHLVENVLAYARLERGGRAVAREQVSIEQLWTRVEPRLSDRAEQAGMELAFESSDLASELKVSTDPAAVAQILFNLVDNAAKYAAQGTTRTIHVSATDGERHVTIRVRDHGPGIVPARARKLFRPFSKSAHEAANSAPGVGLGLSLCRRLARQLGGDLRHESIDGPGAAFTLLLPRG